MRDLPGYDHWHPDLPELEHLISQMRRGTLKEALAALEKLREKEWLFNGLMQGADLRFASLRRADLRNADLRKSTFKFAKLNYADLRNADLQDANLRRVNLGNALLNQTNLKCASLDRASLNRANLSCANLSMADLSHADLTEANLSRADLNNANLQNAFLRDSNLTSTNLKGADFRGVRFGGTILANVDLSKVNGLEEIVHERPSFVDYHTLARSRGRIPDAFLRGVGYSDQFIEHTMPLFRGAIQMFSVFISHSPSDEAFALRLYNRLHGEGVRCWLDTKELWAEDLIFENENRSMSVFGKVVVCCSQNSIGSNWVRREFETALQKEQDGIFESGFLPVDIDGCVLHQLSFDNLELKRRLVADFTNWRDHDAFEDAFAKLVTALNIQRTPDPELSD